MVTAQPGPVLELSVWDVGLVYRDPCHRQGQAFDPGPSVDNLVTVLVAVPAERHQSDRSELGRITESLQFVAL